MQPCLSETNNTAFLIFLLHSSGLSSGLKSSSTSSAGDLIFSVRIKIKRRNFFLFSSLLCSCSEALKPRRLLFNIFEFGVLFQALLGLLKGQSAAPSCQQLPRCHGYAQQHMLIKVQELPAQITPASTAPKPGLRNVYKSVFFPLRKRLVLVLMRIQRKTQHVRSCCSRLPLMHSRTRGQETK